MKKKLTILLTLLMILVLLSGCGSSGARGAKYANSSYAYDDYAYAEEPMMMAEEAYWAPAAAEPAEAVPAPVPNSGDPSYADKQDGTKIIRTANLEMEATDFDAAVQAISALTDACGGYFEESSLNDRGGARYASYTVRIPSNLYRAFLTQVGSVCHVTWQQESAEDVSEVYYDTAGRLETQKTKLARLQQLLAQAEDMEDIIVIENEISETEELIDRLSGTLSHYDALVDYSTIHISLDEVRVLTDITPEPVTFGERFSSALSDGWNDFTEGLGDIIVDLAGAWLLLLFLIIVAVVVILIVKKRRARKGAKAAKSEEPKAPAPAPKPAAPKPAAPVVPEEPIIPAAPAVPAAPEDEDPTA